MIIPEQHQLLLLWQWCNLNTGPTVLGNQNVSAGEYNFQNMSVWSPNWASNFLKSKF